MYNTIINNYVHVNSLILVQLLLEIMAATQEVSFRLEQLFSLFIQASLYNF